MSDDPIKKALEGIDPSGNDGPEPVNHDDGENWKDNLLPKNGHKITAKSFENARLVLQNHPKLKGVIAYNEFSNRIVIRKAVPEWFLEPGTLGTEAESSIRTFIEQDKKNVLGSHYLIAKDAFHGGVVPASKSNAFNPVKEWIESTPWDHKNRATSYLIDNLGAVSTGKEGEYVREVTKLMLLGAVARAYYPGIKFDYVVILQGKQGIGKTAAVNKLCPDDSFFTSSLKSMGKDKEDSIDIQGYWLVELGELSALSSSSLQNVKNFITMKYDNYREPYDKDNTPHARKCIFVGTTNQDSYLRDKTGERRFLPVMCLGADGELFKRPRNYFQQVMAEAKSWLDNITSGLDTDAKQREAVENNLRLSDEVKPIADQKRNDAKSEDLEEDNIDRFLDMSVPDDWKDFSLFQKRDYFLHYDDQRFCESVRNALSKTDSRHQLNEFTTEEALFIIFNVTTGKKMSKADRAAQTKLNTSVQATNEWKKDNHIHRTSTSNGKRGYVRKNK